MPLLELCVERVDAGERGVVRRKGVYVWQSRGIVTLDLTVYGPRVELHSGNYGNWAPNPALALVQLLASMKGRFGTIPLGQPPTFAPVLLPGRALTERGTNKLFFGQPDYCSRVGRIDHQRRLAPAAPSQDDEPDN